MSPRCRHCDSWVSDRWCRVVLPEDMDRPERCPECVASARVARQAAGLEPVTYPWWSDE